MTQAGLINHVRRGHYALRQLGMLGTPAAAEGLAMSVALRRLGSLADNLVLSPLPGTLEPIKPITADLEPGSDQPTVWRDKRWRLRWARSVDELQAVIGQ